MMDASLDTDIVIHLYKSGKKDLLLSSFDKLFIYEYLFMTEMKSKSILVYDEFKKDIAEGRIILVTDAVLIKLGIKGLFENYKESNKYLFDIGELHAVSLAKAMGIVAFLSDDTKTNGPHETLVKELIEGVIPFAFYELLFLKYLDSQMSIEQMFESFQEVNAMSMSSYPMNFRSRMSMTVRRFSKKHGTKRDIDWIEEYCNNKKIDFKTKVINCISFIQKIA